MVFLFWIYVFVASLTSIFVQLYMYDTFGSIAMNVIALMVNYTGLLMGFCGLGYLFAKYQMDLKSGYVAAFFLMALPFLFLYGDVTRLDVFGFMFTGGVGSGLYWLTIHTFELTETKDKEREFYSSMLSVGSQLIGVGAPIIGTMLLLLSASIWEGQSYTLLFAVAPLVYLLGLLFFAEINSYRPKPIRKKDIMHFLNEKRNRSSQLYMLGGSFMLTWGSAVIPVASLLLLENVQSVGIFNSLFGVVSALTLIFAANFRHDGNRFAFLAITALGMSFFFVFPAVSFTLLAFSLHTLGMTILGPLYRVSGHVIDLETMERLAHEESDFYPTMIMRDVSLFVWRIVSCVALLALIAAMESEVASVRAGFFGMAFFPLVTLLGVYHMYRTFRRHKVTG